MKSRKTIDSFEDMKRRTVLRLVRTRGAPTDRVSTATVEELNMPSKWLDVLHVTELRGEVTLWQRVEESEAAARYSWNGASLIVVR